MKAQLVRFGGTFLLLILIGGCVRAPTQNLGSIYSEAAQRHGPGHNPIIVIPGLLGSKLTDTQNGHLIWGAFTGDAADPRDSDSIRTAAIPMEQGKSLAELRDTIEPSGALDRVKIQLLPGFRIEPQAYLQLLLTLGAAGYADQTLGEAGAIDYGTDHYTCFQFDYHWRRTSAENAARLGSFIESRRTYVEAENRRRYGTSDRVQFDIVAHSMGGLIARYYLRYGTQQLPDEGLPSLTWAGAENVSKLILVGPPNAGSIVAIKQLTEGLVIVPWQGRYQPAFVGTMPSVYEVLPRSRHNVLVEANTNVPLDILDPEIWETYRWGLANPDQDSTLAILLPDVSSPAQRRRIALDHLRKCLDNARRFQAAIDLPARPPTGVRISLFTGDAAPTGTVAMAGMGTVTISDTGPGDRTVARYSALMDERFAQPDTGAKLQSPIAWHDVTFLSEDHLGMTKSVTFSDNVLFKLLEQP
jgi:pimeloyl-ACP methyl ester carboxylesterase